MVYVWIITAKKHTQIYIQNIQIGKLFSLKTIYAQNGFARSYNILNNIKFENRNQLENGSKIL